MPQSQVFRAKRTSYQSVQTWNFHWELQSTTPVQGRNALNLSPHLTTTRSYCDLPSHKSGYHWIWLLGFCHILIPRCTANNWHHSVWDLKKLAVTCWLVPNSPHEYINNCTYSPDMHNYLALIFNILLLRYSSRLCRTLKGKTFSATHYHF